MAKPRFSQFSSPGDQTKRFTHKEAKDLRKRDLSRPAFPQAPPPAQGQPQPLPAQEAPSHPAPPQERRKGRGCGCLSFILFLMVMFFSIGFATYAYDYFFGPKPLEDLPPDQQEAAAIHRSQANVHFLLVGVDDKGQEGSRSDTMVFAVFRPVDKDVALLSLPRDSLVTIPGYGEDKLNAAYAYGGKDLLESTVESLLRTRIDHTLIMDFNSFPKIINAMGGVVLDVPQDMYYEDPYQDLLIDIKAGEQRLWGEEALAFVRWRDDGQGDLGRIERQQAFLQALGAKASRLMPWQAVATVLVIQHELESDLTPIAMGRLGLDAIGMGRKDIRSYHLDVSPQYINGVSYALIDQGSIGRTLEEMSYGIPDPVVSEE